ncbi:major histocompatibility complex class I-related gene protein-like [Takifugu flavidus]|uniref:major histocompatibility complex class I-related gene protein-like n=1 Tax=Takifugu flavidus TaxID=433684 RepID=UPI002544578D|nr:major histocompatibility complex class I-related gene protein-like [Takifugu flavidus]
MKYWMYNVKEIYNQTGGVHVMQRLDHCELDSETGEISAFSKFGYDGEDLLELDLKTLHWTALTPKALAVKPRWDSEHRTLRISLYITKVFQLPSVSLLQKTPSSPVSCHATGFYPDRATLSWRKGEEELHEDVDHGEVLLNPDGTFQMSVDLNVSSVPPEDWSSYKCVFQLSGGKEITTTLDKNQIRTNWGETGEPLKVQ